MLKLDAIMINSIESKSFSKQKGLMFVDTMVAGTKINALMDTSASNLFISEGATKELGIIATKGSGWIKTVVSKEVPPLEPHKGSSWNLVLEVARSRSR